LFPVCPAATPRDIAIRCEQFSGEVLRERDLQASLPLMKTSLFLSTAIGALLVTGVAAAADAPTTYVLDPDITEGVLSGENELPTPVNATDTGTVKLTYHPDTKKLCGKITFTPAGFEYTLAHIHEGAADKSGSPYVTLAGDKGAGEITVNVDMTPEQLTKLTGGESYVNIHSEAHPDGAMRNQLVKDDTATPEECEGGSDSDAGASSSGASSSGASSSGSSGSDAGKGSSSSSGTAATPSSTDDGGGCNTSGSHGADAAALLALGAIVTAAARKRRNKKA
jgi:hypothetical protein